MNSSDVFSLNGRVGLEIRFPPLCPSGALKSDPARIGDSPLETWRSSEEFEDAYAAGFGEVPVRTCPELLLDLGYGAEGALCRLPEERWLLSDKFSMRDSKLKF